MKTRITVKAGQGPTQTPVFSTSLISVRTLLREIEALRVSLMTMAGVPLPTELRGGDAYLWWIESGSKLRLRDSTWGETGTLQGANLSTHPSYPVGSGIVLRFIPEDYNDGYIQLIYLNDGQG